MGLKRLPPDVLSALTAGGTGVGVNAEALGADLPEAAFQSAVIAHATARGWTVFSIPDSRRASASGWPDLFCGKDGERCVAAELKRAGEKPRADQRWWLARLAECGVRVFHWTPTPTDWAEIRRVLG